MQIALAQMADYEGIMALHKRYHTDSIREADRPQGFVTTNFTRAQMEALIEKERGVTIAKDEGGNVLAYAMAAPWAFWAPWPLFAHMIEHLGEYEFGGERLSVENSYQYGPICLDMSVRGSGLFEDVFYFSLASMRSRFPIMATFINQINGRSYAAHTRKVPMAQPGTFRFNGNDYYLMACRSDMEADVLK